MTQANLEGARTQEEFDMRPTPDEFRKFEATARADADYYRNLAETGKPELREYHLRCAKNRQEDADFYAHQAAWGDYLGEGVAA